jgi:hypothetical protein
LGRVAFTLSRTPQRRFVTDSMIPPPPPKPDEPGALEDLVDIFTSPAKVFARRAKGGGAALFFIVAIVMSGLSYAAKPVMMPVMEAQMRKSMESNPQIARMSEEQRSSMMETQRKFLPITMVAFPPVVLLATGLFVWIFGKMFGAAVTFGSSIVIASLTFVPRLLGFVVMDIQALMAKDTSIYVNQAQLSVSPARFLDAATTGNVVLTALARFDVFLIWGTVLLAIAYMAAGKLAKGKAITAAVTFWAVAGLFAVWGASRAP